MGADLVLNVRQIGQYPLVARPNLSDVALIQNQGLGGPYQSATIAAILGALGGVGGNQLFVGPTPPADASGEGIVSNFISSSVNFSLNTYSTLAGGALNRIAAGPATLIEHDQTDGSLDFFIAPSGTAGSQIAAWPKVVSFTPAGEIACSPPTEPEHAATMAWTQSLVNDVVHAQAQAITDSTVWRINGRGGNVFLDWRDLASMGGAPLNSPVFIGWPTCPTADTLTGSLQLANTMFVQQAIDFALNMFIHSYPLVWTFNGRSGEITLTSDDITQAGGVPSDSPAFTGIPTTPTPPVPDNSQTIPNTFWVNQTLASNPQGWAPIASPVFTGVPQGPTAVAGSNTGQLATTAFVHNAIVASTTGVSSFNTRTGAVTLQPSDITAVGGALLVSPAFTGTPTATTAPVNDNSTRIATTAFVMTEIAGAVPSVLVSSWNGRSGAVTLQSGDVSGVGGALLAGPNFTGIPTAPTATVGNNTTQLATCAFVLAELANAAVQSFNGRTGAVTLNSADISAAGGATLASPAFTGTPTAPTAVAGTNTTQLATTAFVAAAIAAAPAGVTTFNGRTGTVTLTGSDVSAAGGALLASPAFTGSPTSTTAAPGTATTQIATTAFVAAGLSALLVSPALTGTPTAPTAALGTSSAQIATTAFVADAILSSVASFNGRTGAVTLTSADVSGVGGALLASPGFTGTPTAPTATAGTANTQLATTAFVMAAVAASTAGVASFNGRVGTVTLAASDLTGVGGALLASPAFTGAPTAPTPSPGNNSISLATTAFVAASFAPLASPALTGVPTVPTAAPGTNTTQAASTAFVAAAVATNPNIGLRGHISALTISSTGAANFTVAAGEATPDNDYTILMKLAAPLTKTLTAWAAGGSSGSLDTGTIANSAWYHVHLIANAANTLTDILISTSATAPTMPSGYTKRRRIGSIRTTASGTVYGIIQIGDRFMYPQVVTDVASGTIGAVQHLATFAPSGVNVIADLSLFATGPATAGALVTVGDGPVGTNTQYVGLAFYANQGIQMNAKPMLDTAASFYVASSLAMSGYQQYTAGYTDRRGKDL